MNTFNYKFCVGVCFLYYAFMYSISGTLDPVSKIVGATLMGIIMSVNVLLVSDIAKEGGFMKGRILFDFMED